jgi:sugar lactone lactonase YvrE
LTYPIRIQIDSKGDILALDGKTQRIVRISETGEFKGYIDATGMASESPVVPRSFRIDKNDNLYILDVGSGRVLYTDPGGKVLREIGFPKEYGFFSDITEDPVGNLFLLDSVDRRVFFAPKGSATISPLKGGLEENANFPVSIAVDHQGTLLVVDQNGGGVVILSADGSFRGRQSGIGWKEGLLRYPSQICVNSNGMVFIADRGNNRIQIYSTVQ